MRAAFVDVNPALAEIASRLHGAQRTAGLRSSSAGRTSRPTMSCRRRWGAPASR